MESNWLEKSIPAPNGFQGRLSRQGWWLNFALVAILPAAAWLLNDSLALVLGAILGVRFLAATVRRGNDIGQEGLVSILACAALMFTCIQAVQIAMREDVTPFWFWLCLSFTVGQYRLWFYPGTPGPNEFGEVTWN